MFRIMKKAMALVAVCALVFAACSKSEGAGGNAASAQSTGSQQKSATPSSKSTVASSKSSGGQSAKIPEPKLAEAKDFDYELTSDAKGILITKYKGAAVSVIVPSEIEGFPVTEMSTYTFDDYKETLVNVVLPDTLKKLPECMFGGFGSFYVGERQWFYRYSTLKTVTLPADITKIPVNFFMGSSIESIVIPSKVTKIDRGAFSECTALESIRLPGSVKIIEMSAFRNCTGLKSINLPNDIKLYEISFSGCSSLSEIIIPEGGKIDFGWDDDFRGCSSLSIATQARLRELGYEGSF